MDLPASRARNERQVVKRRRLALLTSALVMMLLAAAAGGLWWSRREAAVAPNAQQATKIGCPLFGADADRGSFCGNLVQDSSRRAPISDEQRQGVEHVAGPVRTAASHAGWCISSNDPTCAHRPPSHPPMEQDVKARRYGAAHTSTECRGRPAEAQSDPPGHGRLPRTGTRLAPMRSPLRSGKRPRQTPTHRSSRPGRSGPPTFGSTFRGSRRKVSCLDRFLEGIRPTRTAPGHRPPVRIELVRTMKCVRGSVAGISQTYRRTPRPPIAWRAGGVYTSDVTGAV
jgi:hypothetical protein